MLFAEYFLEARVYLERIPGGRRNRQLELFCPEEVLDCLRVALFAVKQEPVLGRGYFVRSFLECLLLLISVVAHLLLWHIDAEQFVLELVDEARVRDQTGEGREVQLYAATADAPKDILILILR